MKRLLLKLWHRFTLSKTARHVYVPDEVHPGTLTSLAVTLNEAAEALVPMSMVVDTRTRIDTSLPSDTVRIVLETNR